MLTERRRQQVAVLVNLGILLVVFLPGWLGWNYPRPIRPYVVLGGLVVVLTRSVQETRRSLRLLKEQHRRELDGMQTASHADVKGLDGSPAVQEREVERH